MCVRKQEDSSTLPAIRLECDNSAMCFDVIQAGYSYSFIIDDRQLLCMHHHHHHHHHHQYLRYTIIVMNEKMSLFDSVYILCGDEASNVCLYACMNVYMFLCMIFMDLCMYASHLSRCCR